MKINKNLGMIVSGAIILLLAACSGGGSSTPAPLTPVSVSGLADKGPIANATITVFRLNPDGTKGTDSIASTTTDGNGTYQLHIPVQSDIPVDIVLTGGSFVDEATGATVDLRDGDSLETYAYIPLNGILTAQVTPLTTLAAALARYHLTHDGQTLADAVSNSTKEVSTLFGVGNILNVTPPSVSGVSDAQQPARNYTLFLAGFSQLAQDDSKNVFDIISSMAAGLASNGVLDNTDPSISPASLVLATQRFIKAHIDNNQVGVSAQNAGALVTDVVNPTKILQASATNNPPVAADVQLTIDEDTVATGLLNGSDADPTDVLKYTIVSNGTKGTAVVSNEFTGAFSYTPNPNVNGTDSFTYLVSDGVSGAYGTVTINITPVNDAPHADNLSLVTDEDHAVSGQLIAADVESNSLTFSIVSNGKLGTVQISDPSTGAFTYTPNPNANGVDTITFRADDGQSVNNLSNIATVTVTINPVNDPPTAADSVVNTLEDTPVQGVMSASDVDGDNLTYSIITQPDKGKLAFDASSGQFTYTPFPNINGLDSFSFKVNDGTVDSNVATVSITINAVNDIPAAIDQVITTNEDIAVNGNLQASDVDSPTLTYSIVQKPAKGQAVITNPTTGAFTYTPNANLDGVDVFTFKANDGSHDSNVASVTVTISPVNDAPVASNGTLSLDEDTTAIGVLQATDVDSPTLTYSIVSDGSKGKAVITNAATGAYTYTPKANTNGTDTFTFKANDGSLDSNTATVTVTIKAVNDAPVASNGTLKLDEDSIAAGVLKATDVDSPTLTYSIVSNGSKGTVVITDAAIGAYTYKPNLNANGTDSFSFKANDGSLDSNTAVVTVTINPVNDAPVASDGTLSLDEDTTATGVLQATDVDSTTLTYSIVSDGSKGKAVITNAATGAYTYTPKANTNGTDTFTFKANDGALDSNTATVTVTIKAVNDAPVITSTAITTGTQDTAYTYRVKATDIDLGDTLTYTLTTAPVGMNIDSGTGLITWTPTNAEVGDNAVTVQVTDNGTNPGPLSVTQSFTVTVINVNDAPVITSTANTSATQDVAYSYQVAASDPDIGDSLTYSLTTKPVGMTISTAGLIQWTPTNSDAMSNGGNYSVVVQVTDNGTNPGPLSVTQSFTVTVINVNDAPVITSTANTSATQDVAYSYQVAASDPDVGDSLTYSLTTKPVGMTISAAGLIQWTPTNSDAMSNGGNHGVVVQVNDNGTNPGPMSATQSFTIHVINVNDPPIAANDSFTTKEDTVYSGPLSATDPDADPLTYSVVDQGSKGTVTIDPQTGAFNYTPAPDVNGADSFTYKVNDGTVDSNTATVTVAITPVTDSIMVVAAHPDDEALMAAGVMKRALDRGDSVKVVIVTNGDYNGKSDGLAREAESKAALADKLGLSEDDIIFLGYPDAGLLTVYNDYPNATDSGFVSNAGQSKTYGDRGLGRKDFHSYWTGAAADYNRSNLVADLKDLLNRYQPTQIYTHSPFDQHFDHRVTYYTVRDAAQSLMKERASFHPDVYSMIIHDPKHYPYLDKWLPGTGTVPQFGMEADEFWPVPAFTGTPGNPADMQARFTPTQAFSMPLDLGLTPLVWADRLSLPVPTVMQGTDKTSNLKYQMINSYATQIGGYGFIYAFGKSDEYFWKQTWSRNIAMRAVITASSENTAAFQGASNVADSIADGYRDQNGDGISEGNSQAEWVTKSQKAGAWVQLDWPQSYTIDKVVLNDRPNANDQILSGTLSFSDGSTVSVGTLPNDGSKLEVNFASRTVTWVRFTVDSVSATTTNAGLAEMEVWTAAPPSDNLSPFFTRGPTSSAYTLTGGMTATLSAPAYDSNGDPVTYTWQSQMGATISGSGPAVTYTAPTAVSGTDIVTVTIDDGVSQPVTTEFAIIVQDNNVALLASATASSQKYNQGPAKAIDGVVDGYVDSTTGDYTKEWSSNGEGVGAWLRLEWSQCYVIDRVRLYDRPNSNDQILAAKLLFSDGSTEDVGTLPNDGSQYELTFPARCTDSLTLEITSVSGTTTNVGLAEMEVFGLAGAQTVQMRQDFDGGSAPNWTVVDNATTHAPSAWSVVNKQYQENSGGRYPDDVGILGQTVDGYEIGTYSRYDAFAHGNMDLRLRLRSDSIGTLGVMFGYQDDNNYYRFSLSKRRGYRRLEKKVAGVFSVLASSPQSYTTGQWMSLRIVKQDGVIIVFLDDEQIMAVADSTFFGGKIALWAGRNGRSVFDDIVVLSPPNQPVVGLTTPVEYAVDTNGLLDAAAVVTTTTGVGGVEFVVDQGAAGEQSMIDYTAPYAAHFNFPAAGNHEVRAYALNSTAQRLSGTETVDIQPGIGVNGLDLVSFGDSITDGVNDDLASDDISADGRNTSGGYEPLLNNALTSAYGQPVTVIDEGNPGDTALNGVGKIESVKNWNLGAQAFLVMFGTNDSSGSLPVPSGLGLHPGDVGYSGSYKDSMQKIVTAVTGAGKKIFLAKVPPVIGNATMNASIQQYNQVIDELVSENAGSGLVFLGPDFYTYFTNNPTDIGPDHIHPTGAGYVAMGGLWKSSLMGNL